ncbi:zinc-binding dehydrogenase [Absicoccus intestinalis]|uniref:Zinc-binding dehydrogenase n=1 Tax=Absicoccus intestinalis TaxID=2926319 RepID=A0ABU4WQ72_9FIRM|nr:zinc-binding dehydrogenase [Absicoccus sp. CLA-KB-P134]MDX8417627.1 zinc-binding dehydrogenase [Absicoccus sp. CLA-KB-P134]
MKTFAVRLYGKHDLRLEEFELPEMQENEILAKVITDSVCMSTLKLVNQGEDHKKAPNDLKNNPVIIGHEFCGIIMDVGAKWSHKYQKGEKFVIQANLLLEDKPYSCPGYSYHDMGGDATYCIISDDVMRADCLIPYRGETFFAGSLVEPLSCVIGAIDSQYHIPLGTHTHEMGLKKGGNLLILGGTGPMGMLAIDYALHGEKKPKHIVITDHHQDKLDRAQSFLPSQNGVEVTYLNTKGVDDEVSLLQEVVDGQGYDDILVMSARKSAVSEASILAADDACIDFFAGPQDKNFMAEINFYDIHYSRTHYMGISGGTADDMRKAVRLIEDGTLDPSMIVTHVLGLNQAAYTTEHQKEIGGAKKVIYTHKKMDLTALSDVSASSELGQILAKTKGVWSKQAEDYVLSHMPDID